MCAGPMAALARPPAAGRRASQPVSQPVRVDNRPARADRARELYSLVPQIRPADSGGPIDTNRRLSNYHCNPRDWRAGVDFSRLIVAGCRALAGNTIGRRRRLLSWPLTSRRAAMANVTQPRYNCKPAAQVTWARGHHFARSRR